MATSEAETPGYHVPKSIYEALARGTPAERTAIVLRLINEHPQNRLELPSLDGMPAVLDGVDLDVGPKGLRRSGASRPGNPGEIITPRVSLRSANLRGARLRQAQMAYLDLRQADLRDATIGEADLTGALLEGADLRNADLASAKLRGAKMEGIDLRGAMLEEADLRRASLRFANLEDAAFENACLQRCDLWGAYLSRAEFRRCDLRRVMLRESTVQGVDFSHADLRGASAGKANFSSARFTGADLRGVVCTGANFTEAVFTDAKIQGLDLSDCNIARVHLSGAWLEKTHFGLDQLGGTIGEEIEGNYKEARKGYLALERAFQDQGDHDASSWAYRRRRRMQKLESLRKARESWRGGQRKAAMKPFLNFVNDQFVEWLCDYGESIPRVLASLLVVFVVFVALFAATNGVVRVTETPQGPVRTATRNLVDLIIYSLLAMTGSNNDNAELLPGSENIHLLSAGEAFLGVALTGLLGFVIGNRVRR